MSKVKEKEKSSSASAKPAGATDAGEGALYKQSLTAVLSGLEKGKYKRQDLETLAHALGDAFASHEPEPENITEVDLHAMFGKRPLHISSEFMRDSLPAFNVRPGKEGGRESFRSLINPDFTKVKGIVGVSEKQLPRRMSLMTDSNLSDKSNMCAADDKVRQYRRASLPHSDPVFESDRDDSDEGDEYLIDTTILKTVDSLAVAHGAVRPTSAKDRNHNNSLASHLEENESQIQIKSPDTNTCQTAVVQQKGYDRMGVEGSQAVKQDVKLKDEDIEAEIEGLGRGDQGGLCGEPEILATGLTEILCEENKVPPTSVAMKAYIQECTTPVFDREILDCLNGQAESCEPGTPTASIDSPLLQTLDEELRNADQGRTSKRLKRRTKSAKGAVSSRKAVGSSKTLRSKLSLFEQSAVKRGVTNLALKYYKSMTQTVKKSPQRQSTTKQTLRTEKTRVKNTSCNVSKTETELTKPKSRTKSMKMKTKHVTSILS